MFLWGISSSQTIYVPVNSRVYDFLERMEAKQIVPVILDGTLPMTRKEIGNYLHLCIKNQDNLSKSDQEMLSFLITEYREEIGDTLATPRQIKTRLTKLMKSPWVDPWMPDFIYKNGRDMLFLPTGPVNLYCDPVFLRSRIYASADTLPSQERIFQDTNGFVLWGTIGNYFGFYTDIRDTREWGTRKYPSGNTTATGLGFVRGNGSQIYHDETIAHLTFSYKFLNVQYGKDENKWGNGYVSQLLLSDSPTSYDQLKIQIMTPRLKFTYLLGWLKHFDENYFFGNPQQKSISAHRLEFSPHPLIDIGLHEAIIYANRKIVPAYLNPVMFFRSAEHYLGDLDNAFLGLDMEFKGIPKTKIYGDYFIDDMTTSKIGTGFYGNKYGYTLGCFHVDLFGLANIDVRIEYTKIRPFTYSHKFENTAFTHFDTVVGHSIGPNSDLLFFELVYNYSRWLKFNMQYQKQRHGANPPLENIGGDPMVPHSSFSDSKYIPFLSGVLEQKDTITFKARLEVIRNGFFQTFYKYYWMDDEWENYGGIKPGKRSEFVFQFSLNY